MPLPETNLTVLNQQAIDQVAQMATATSMAICSSYCLERKFLRKAETDSVFVKLCERVPGNCDLTGTSWIRIKQVGRPADLGSCFETLQKILRSQAFPQRRTLFLIIEDNDRFYIFLGLNRIDGQIDTKTVAKIDSFLNISWPGINTEPVKLSDDNYKVLQSFIQHRYRSAYAFTGIPSIDKSMQAYPHTVEFLCGGKRSGTSFAYLVIAEPVNENVLDEILFSCDEIVGQAKSFESFSFSKSIQQGMNQSFSEAISKSVSEIDTENRTARTLLAIGIGIAACAGFPPALTMAAGEAASSAAALIGESGPIVGLGLLNGFIPRTTETESQTHTTGISESYSQTIGGNIVNRHMSTLAEMASKYRERYEKGKALGMWKVGCYLFDDESASSSGIQLKALLSGDSSRMEPIRQHDISSFLADNKEDRTIVPFINSPDLYMGYVTRKGGTNIPFLHPFGRDFSTLTTYLTTEELSSMINFPLHSMPGINVIDCPPEFCGDMEDAGTSSSVFQFGDLINRGLATGMPAYLDFNTLSRHSLVCGVNGSGKTNTVLSILKGMREMRKPFIIIEPAKTEYVNWALEYNSTISNEEDKIKIFIPGCNEYCYSDVRGERVTYYPEKLRINPFEVVSAPGTELRVLSHIDRLKSIFASAFPVQDIMPVVLEHLLYRAYNLERFTDVISSKDFPMLENINLELISSMMSDFGYGKENTMNIGAAVRTRFNSLKYGWKAELLNNKRLGVSVPSIGDEGSLSYNDIEFSWKDFFSHPIIINLSYAGDEQDRSFIMSLLLQFLYEYRISEAEAGGSSYSSDECRHLVVVEEAHRVMTRCEDPSMPQYKSGLMFSNMLSEIRAYGQGMMIVDQVPSRLIEDAIKNTNLKIVHKLVAADDAEYVAKCMGLNDEQLRYISRLPVGQAIISGLNCGSNRVRGGSEAYLAQIRKKS